MKNFKFLLLGVALMVVTMFSSCLKSDDTPNNYMTYVTVGSGYLGTEYLIQDITGIKMVAPASSMLVYDLKVGDRALLTYKLQDGFTADINTKEYKIDVINCQKIPSRRILEKPVVGSAGDTLRNDSIASFYAAAYYWGFPEVWAYNGYVTTGIIFYAKSYGYVDLIKDNINKDTLFLKLNLNADRGSNQGGGNYSFYMPEKMELTSAGIQPKNDSIVVAVSAKVMDGYSSGTKKESRYWKYKLNY